MCKNSEYCLQISAGSLLRKPSRRNLTYYVLNDMSAQNSEILIYNFSQQKIPRKILTKTAQRILDILRQQPRSLSLVLVTPSEIKKLNYYWRGKNKITTVLTFSGGDIFLCPLAIKKEARQNALGLKKTYQLLLAHSILHLLGHTHETQDNFGRMRKLEDKIISSL